MYGINGKSWKLLMFSENGLEMMWCSVFSAVWLLKPICTLFISPNNFCRCLMVLADIQLLSLLSGHWKRNQSYQDPSVFHFWERIKEVCCSNSFSLGGNKVFITFHALQCPEESCSSSFNHTHALTLDSLGLDWVDPIQRKPFSDTNIPKGGKERDYPTKKCCCFHFPLRDVHECTFSTNLGALH